MNDYFRKQVLGRAAVRASEETHYNKDKQEGFILGAEWAARHILKCMEIHPMEDDNTIKQLDVLRLKDFKETIYSLLSKAPEEKNEPIDT